MFSNLDNFLSGKIDDKELDDDSLELGAPNADDSLDLDFDVKIPQARKARKPADAKNAAFVPAKGQKLAAKRLQKIGDTLDKNLKEQDYLQKLQEDRNKSKEKKAAKAGKAASPQKRGRQRRFKDVNDSSDSSKLSSQVFRVRHVEHDPNTIVLGCDDVFIGGPAVNVNRNLATASGISAEDTMESSVSIRINGKIEKYEINPILKLSFLLAKIGEKKSVPVDNITLMYKDKTVSMHDTLDSIGYIQGLILHAHISEDATSKSKSACDPKANANQLEIKIEAEGRKRPFITYIGPNDKLATLAYACSMEFKCDVSKVALEFDGEFVNFKDTPEDLGLEGGEIMDFFKKS